MALTNKQIVNWVDYLYDRVGYAGDDSAVYTLSDGREIKLEIVPDEDNWDRFREDEFFGQVEPSKADPYTGYSKRPEGFNGAARKFDTRDGRYWWQPPAEMSSPENIQQVFDIVRGFYNGDWWYVGVVVTIKNPCVCGEAFAKEWNQASLWGLESNQDDYLKETIGELIREAYSAPQTD
jgi:hypothetical protein